MADTYDLLEIPIEPALAQTFSVPLAGTVYRMTFRYRSEGGGWCMSIADQNNVPLVTNRAVTTGRDLLEQLRYLGIQGGLVVQTDGDPSAVPTFENFGLQAHLYFVRVPR